MEYGAEQLDKIARKSTKLFENQGDPTRIHRDHLGNLTAGWGFLLREGRKIDYSIVEALFEQSWREAEEGINKLLRRYNVTVDPVRRLALKDMCFQMGEYRLGEFRRMWAALSAEDYEKAGNELLDSAYARDPHLRKQGRPQRMHYILVSGKLPIDMIEPVMNG